MNNRQANTHLISLAATISLIERSERTLWRMVAEGSIQREIVGGKALFQIDSLKPFFSIRLGEEDLHLIEEADAGNATAQTDLALIFLTQGKPAPAIYWLELAIQNEHADAMNHFGNCYICGKGISKDENLGLIWIARAAALGHAISKAQIANMPGALGIRNRS